MIVVAMSLHLRPRAGQLQSRINAFVVWQAPRPGACRRTVVVELAAGQACRGIDTTHADSRVIVRRPAEERRDHTWSS